MRTALIQYYYIDFLRSYVYVINNTGGISLSQDWCTCKYADDPLILSYRELADCLRSTQKN